MISESFKDYVSIQFLSDFDKLDINACNGGVYMISAKVNGIEKNLYIGESVYVIKRCGEHLYKFLKNPKYFGFDFDDQKYVHIELRFLLLESIECASLRKNKEFEFIKTYKPITQLETSDRMLNINKKIETVMNQFNLKR